MFGYDVKETTSREIAGHKLAIGLLPDGKFDELVARYDAETTPYFEHLKSHPDGLHAPGCQECRRLLTEATPVLRELVAWGLRSVNDKALPTRPHMFAGVSYDVLDEATLDRLQVGLRGRLLIPLAFQVLTANRLDPREVLGFFAGSGADSVQTS